MPAKRKLEVADVDVVLPDLPPAWAEDSHPPADLLTAADWVPVATVELNEPAARGVQIVTSGAIGHGAGLGTLYQYAYIEVRIVLERAQQRSVVAIGAVGGSTGPYVWTTDQPVRAGRILVEARRIVDGAPGATVGPDVIYAAAQVVTFNR